MIDREPSVKMRKSLMFEITHDNKRRCGAALAFVPTGSALAADTTRTTRDSGTAPQQKQAGAGLRVCYSRHPHRERANVASAKWSCDQARKPLCDLTELRGNAQMASILRPLRCVHVAHLVLLVEVANRFTKLAD